MLKLERPGEQKLRQLRRGSSTAHDDNEVARTLCFAQLAVILADAAPVDAMFVQKEHEQQQRQQKGNRLVLHRGSSILFHPRRFSGLPGLPFFWSTETSTGKHHRLVRVHTLGLLGVNRGRSARPCFHDSKTVHKLGYKICSTSESKQEHTSLRAKKSLRTQILRPFVAKGWPAEAAGFFCELRTQNCSGNCRRQRVAAQKQKCALPAGQDHSLGKNAPKYCCSLCPALISPGSSA